MLRLILAASAALILCAPAWAECVGTSDFQSCWDDSGNNYTVNRLGDMTIMNGHNSRTGSSWSQDSLSVGGDMVIHNGRDADGNSWSATCGPWGCN